ncbi:unnamed protein product, partial [Allacma fusca]
LMHDFIS